MQKEKRIEIRDWSKLKRSDWYYLLIKQPQLIDKLKVSGLSRDHVDWVLHYLGVIRIAWERGPIMRSELSRDHVDLILRNVDMAMDGWWKQYKPISLTENSQEK